MGRKDISEKRRNQILDAFEYCVLEYGLSNTTIKKIAQKAQVNKGTIHHYIGNKTDISKAWIERLADFNIVDIRNFLQERKSDMSLQSFVEYAFDEWARHGHQKDLMIGALMTESAQDPSIQKSLLETYTSWINLFAEEIKMLYPDATKEKCHYIAYTIMSMAYGSAVMIWLGFDRKVIPEIRSLAKILIRTLEGNS
jgi:AcrR family transcriptional regulator